MTRRLGFSCQARMGVQTAHRVDFPSCGGMVTNRLWRGLERVCSMAAAMVASAGVMRKSGSTAAAISAALLYCRLIRSRVAADSSQASTAAFCSGGQLRDCS